MDTIKAKISLELLTSISPIIKPNSQKINLSTNKDILFLLQDTNPNYDFFFRAEKEAVTREGKIEVIFTCKPFSISENIAKGTNLNLDNFKDHLSKWFANIEQYKVEKLTDDPIEKEYQDEFYKDFKIVDADAEKARFSFPQQVLLVNYIEKVEAYIANEVVEFTDEEKKYFLNEAKTLKQEIITETKDSYIKKQSGFWAKLRKKSLKVCDFVVKEFAKEVIKEMTKKGITIGWDALPHYIEQAKNLLGS